MQKSPAERKAGGFPHIRQRSRKSRTRLNVGEIPALPSQRAGDPPVLIFSEGFECFSTDVSLTCQTEDRLRISLVVRSLDNADQIVSTHGHVDILDFSSCLLERLAPGVEPLWAAADFRRSLLCPVKQRNVGWHTGSPL